MPQSIGDFVVLEGRLGRMAAKGCLSVDVSAQAVRLSDVSVIRQCGFSERLSDLFSDEFKSHSQ